MAATATKYSVAQNENATKETEMRVNGRAGERASESKSNGNGNSSAGKLLGKIRKDLHNVFQIKQNKLKL